jgi:hypothetical protein
MAVAMPSAATPGVKAPFEKLDSNRDGQLTPDEHEGKARTGQCSRADDEANKGS